MNSSSVVLVMVMLLASQVSCSPLVNFSWDTPRHFCGSQLANVLALICSHGYNFHPVNDDVTVPSRRRKRDAIVEECCENTCTPHHLKAYCWDSNNQRSDKRSTDPSIERPSVDKHPKPQKAPTGYNNPPSQRPVTAADNRLLAESTTAAIPISNSIIPDSSKEHSRQNDTKYAPKKEAVKLGRVKTVTPYFDKMPSVIVTKTQL